MNNKFKVKTGFTPLEILFRKISKKFFCPKSKRFLPAHLFSYPYAPKSSKIRFLTGFTLIETLIYAALISFIIGGSLIVVYQILKTNSNVYNKIIVEQEANFLLQKIRWTMTGVSTINSPAVGATSSTLSINKINFSRNPIIIDLNSNNMRMKSSSSQPFVLNSQNVTVQNLVFQHLAASSSIPEAININLTVSARQFSTTIYLRH